MDAVVIEAACVRLPVARDMIAADGTVTDPGVRDGLALVLRTVADAVAAMPDGGLTSRTGSLAVPSPGDAVG